MRGTIGTAVLLFLAVAFAGPGRAAQNGDTKKAVEAAGEWLAVVDDGRYPESWEAAAVYFRETIGKQEWAKRVAAVRNPLGRLVRREMVSAQRTTSLPGAPDGEYVVVQYRSSFENKKTAVETVTPMKGKDGAWRVSGYFIR